MEVQLHRNWSNAQEEDHLLIGSQLMLLFVHRFLHSFMKKRPVLDCFLKKPNQQVIREAKVKLYNHISLKREGGKEHYDVSLCYPPKEGPSVQAA